MKTLRKSLEEILTPTRLAAVSAHKAPKSPAGVVAFGSIIDDILKALSEYVRTVEEVECMLLELLPDHEFTVKRKVSDTCTLVYSISKE